MHRIFSIVLFVTGMGFLVMGGYLLYAGYMRGGFFMDWQNLLFTIGICLFGYLLIIAGYRMSTEDRF
jgi:hypothetical protein